MTLTCLNFSARQHVENVRIARLAAATDLPFLFTSTAMVFDHEPDGPHRPADPRTARDDYGRMKIASEDAVLAATSAVWRACSAARWL